MSKKIEIEIDDLLFLMIERAVQKRNHNIGANISINDYVSLLAEKSFKLILIENYDNIFDKLINDVDAIDREIEGKELSNLFTIDELIADSKRKDKLRERCHS